MTTSTKLINGCCYGDLWPDVRLADDHVVDMQRQTHRTVGAIAAHHHLVDGLPACPCGDDPR
ncbi:MAG TPA: hypothetical protein VF043_38250, partial [Ktedonobacteraceae bacterium]